MFRYIILNHYTPTQANTAPVMDQNYFFGKNATLLHKVEDFDLLSELGIDDIDKETIRKLGYTNRTCALRAMKKHMKLAKEEEEWGWWNAEVKLIAVEV